VAQELLGALIISRGSARPWGWWWGESKKSNKLSKLPRIYENSQFLALFALKIAKNALFFLKVLNIMYYRDIF
jgi:hypothetical protein